jgi:hypothetical protein
VKPGPKPQAPALPRTDLLPADWTHVETTSSLMGGQRVLIARTDAIAASLAAQTPDLVLTLLETQVLQDVPSEDLVEAIELLGRRRRQAIQ